MCVWELIVWIFLFCFVVVFAAIYLVLSKNRDKLDDD